MKIYRIAIMIALAVSLSARSSATLGADATQVAQSTKFPNADTLLNAGRDDNDWILPGKTYQDNRYTGLEQITPRNVRMLAQAWSTEIADNGQQEAAPIVWHGTMYLSTPHESVLALDAATGKLKWQFPYNPSYTITYAVNQGVGIADGKIFVATQDCRVIAIDAATGKQLWNVNGCPNDRYASTANSWFHMAAYIYKNQIILGTSGGDTGAIGHVMAFSTSDGHSSGTGRRFPGRDSRDIAPGQATHGSMGAVPSGQGSRSIPRQIRYMSRPEIRAPIWSTFIGRD
jgi:glucose dehydrogenase